VRFIDTNVFLRYFVEDIPIRAAESRELFIAIDEGRIEAVTCEAVIAEIVYVLRSKKTYAWHVQEIHDRMLPVLSLSGLTLPNREVYFRALDLIIDHPFLDFEDAICTAHMERLGISEIYSYDLGFDRIPGVKRVTPMAE